MEERERRQIQREKIRKFANLYLSKRACPCGVSDQEILIRKGRKESRSGSVEYLSERKWHKEVVC